ncbi:MAG: DUF6580 family putative transport protein [Planctomycetaceae bacterium]
MSHMRFFAVLALVFTGAALRLTGMKVPFLGVDDPTNFAPIGAIAIFCGLHFRNRLLALAIPLLATFAADLVLAAQNDDFRSYLFSGTMLFVYVSWFLYVVCGMGLRSFWKKAGVDRSKSILRGTTLVGTSLLGSVVFFLVSNFGVWVASSFYPRTMAGLAECFVAAVPFFRGTLQGDLLYLFGLTAIYAVLCSMITADEKQSAALYAD